MSRLAELLVRQAVWGLVLLVGATTNVIAVIFGGSVSGGAFFALLGAAAALTLGSAIVGLRVHNELTVVRRDLDLAPPTALRDGLPFRVPHHDLLRRAGLDRAIAVHRVVGAAQVVLLLVVTVLAVDAFTR